tara:strand:- start:270 stop:980 length:711 start_codon:yes stop_codon:yes gene_type:complete
MPSPSKPSDFSNLVLTSSATLCDRFKAVLLTLPSKIYDLANYLLDADGNPSKTFAKDLASNTGIWSIGDVKASLNSATPDGWIECNGAAISRTTYSDLYAVISTAYGDGDGTSTFNVPDMRARALIGRNESANQVSGLNSYSLGSEVGSETVQLSVRHLPKHNHVASGAVGKKVWHDEQTGLANFMRSDHFGEDDADAGVSYVEQLFEEVGEDDPVPIVQPSLVCRFLIYTGYFPS